MPEEVRYDIKRELASRPLAFEMLTRVIESDDPVTITELARATGRSLPTVYEAMKFLENRKLISSKKIGREREYVKSGKTDLWDLVRSPALRDEVRKSIYRFQREPAFAIQDFLTLLSKSLEGRGFEVQQRRKLEMGLGEMELDLVVSFQGRKFGVDLKRIGRTGDVKERFLAEVGLVTALAKERETDLVGIILLVLIPHGHMASDFDEWKAIDIVRAAGTKAFRSDAIFERVEDEDLANPAFVSEVANRMKEKLSLTQ